ncbi:MAG: hypothetical protein AAF382_05295 [Pseudomonadota bacterium]
MIDALFDKGWVKFPTDAALAPWIKAARDAALERVNDPEERRVWLQCEGTWFVGVDSLPSDPEGAVGQAGPLTGAAYAAAQEIYGVLPLHPGQISVIYPGYPRPRDTETDAAFRYRLKRDAAHVDGLLGVGQPKKRMLKEQHAYILGLPLTSCDEKASPLVVWEGSHKRMAAAFHEALGERPAEQWDDVDLTAIYQATRQEVFDTCPRVKVTAEPGEAYLVHRLALHGVAPWEDGAKAPSEGRMIAYFRPELPPGTRGWLDLP